MLILAFVVRLVLGLLSLRGVRWAYVAFVVLGLLYFPAKVNFHLDPHPCELTFDLPLAIHSLTNYPHIVMFALLFFITSCHFSVVSCFAFALTTSLTVLL